MAASIFHCFDDMCPGCGVFHSSMVLPYEQNCWADLWLSLQSVEFFFFSFLHGCVYFKLPRQTTSQCRMNETVCCSVPFSFCQCMFVYLLDIRARFILFCIYSYPVSRLCTCRILLRTCCEHYNMIDARSLSRCCAITSISSFSLKFFLLGQAFCGRQFLLRLKLCRACGCLHQRKPACISEVLCFWKHHQLLNVQVSCYIFASVGIQMPFRFAAAVGINQDSASKCQNRSNCYFVSLKCSSEPFLSLFGLVIKVGCQFSLLLIDSQLSILLPKRPPSQRQRRS